VAQNYGMACQNDFDCFVSSSGRINTEDTHPLPQKSPVFGAQFSM
jgi:hypothetical protein